MRGFCQDVLGWDVPLLSFTAGPRSSAPRFPKLRCTKGSIVSADVLLRAPWAGHGRAPADRSTVLACPSLTCNDSDCWHLTQTFNKRKPLNQDYGQSPSQERQMRVSIITKSSALYGKYREQTRITLPTPEGLQASCGVPLRISQVSLWLRRVSFGRH